MKLPCPYPGCQRELTGETAAFCFEHHVAADAAAVRPIIRLKTHRKRSRDEATRAHLDDAIGSLTRRAIQTIQTKGGKVHA